MDALLRFDTEAFMLINHLPHPSLSDVVALAISGVGTAGIIWFILATVLFLKEEKKDHWFFAPFFLAGGLSYFVSELLLKPLVGRIRPSVDMGAILVGSQSTDPSFPSGHATIAFAMAVVLSRKETRFKWVFYTLAVLISLSRVYLGRHYPLDVIAGGLFGWGIGMLVNRFL